MSKHTLLVVFGRERGGSIGVDRPSLLALSDSPPFGSLCFYRELSDDKKSSGDGEF